MSDPKTRANLTRLFIFVIAVASVIILYSTNRVDRVLAALSILILVGGILWPKTRELLCNARLDHLGLVVLSGLGAILMSVLSFVTLLPQKNVAPEKWQVYLNNRPDSALKEGEAIPPNGLLTVRHSTLKDGYPWVIVRQPRGRYFPLSQEIEIGTCRVTPRNTTGATTFDVTLPTNVGQAEDGILPFQLVFVVADKTADASLSRLLFSWCKTGEYPGITPLPNGCQQVGEISLKRAKGL